MRTKEQFQQVVEGICRSFTDIVENTDRKRFKKLCLDITQVNNTSALRLLYVWAI